MRPEPAKGRCAIVTSAGHGMRWTPWLHRTSEAMGGRRRRVVLISRRWDQALAVSQARRGLSSPAPRGERVISRKTIVQGMPECSAYLWFLTRVLSSLHTRPRVRLSARHSLRPLNLGGNDGQSSGTSCRGNVESHPLSSWRKPGPITTGLGYCPVCRPPALHREIPRYGSWLSPGRQREAGREPRPTRAPHAACETTRLRPSCLAR